MHCYGHHQTSVGYHVLPHVYNILFVALALPSSAASMPYHLLYRPQQTKGHLFRLPDTSYPQIESSRSSSDRHREDQLLSLKQIAERDLVPATHLTISGKPTTPLAPRGFFIWLAFLIIVTTTVGVGCLYCAHLRRKRFFERYCPPRDSADPKKKEPIDLSFTAPSFGGGNPKLADPTPSFSHSGLNKRRKPPLEESLDLEALKPESIIPGRGNALTPSLAVNDTVDAEGVEVYERGSDSDGWIPVESSGRSTSTFHAPNATRTRRVSAGSVETLGIVMRPEPWDTASKIIGGVTCGHVNEGPVLPTIAERGQSVKGGLELDKYFYGNGEGIRRDSVS
ncbi:MAG: hypothetical protein LQ352_005187 [Teloschistes flavicans]|nr:MAG: hypothetical protein LQ352_005187 [Teloschistes flavicans]